MESQHLPPAAGPEQLSSYPTRLKTLPFILAPFLLLGCRHNTHNLREEGLTFLREFRLWWAPRQKQHDGRGLAEGSRLGSREQREAQGQEPSFRS